MKVKFYTLGCRLNQAETDQYAQELTKNGFIVTDKNDFDIAVINTCAVTHKADRESRQAVRQLKKQCAQATIIMTGCSDFKLPEVDYCFKNKERFVEHFLENFASQDQEKIYKFNKTRANIKIQTGCDNYCTYCITTYRRGKSRSFSPKSIIEQIKKKERQGIKEVVLTGVNIGQYKYRGLDLTNLIERILRETSIARVRLSSIDPEFVNNNKAFMKLFKHARLCQHLHLSLQSGSDAVLKRMNRRYTTGQYLKIIKEYYAAYPLFGFTTDVIVGFPGETDLDFQDSLDFVKKCGFLKIHIFRYSKRAGTPAAEMQDQVDERIKKKRAQELEKINTQLNKKFVRKMKGEELEVLFEGKRDGYWIGHAGNYYLVKYKSKRNLKNQIKVITLPK